MDIKDQARQAQLFALQNLKQCCSELAERTITGELPANAKMFELVALCRYAGASAQMLAERLVSNAAIEYVVTHFKD